MTRHPLDLLTNLLSDRPDFSLLEDAESWALIKESARRHGLRPLIAWIALPHAGGEKRAWCEQILVRSRERHLSNLRSLCEINAALDKRGIRAVSMKGPLLARRYYSPPFLRKPSTDLDLAVAESDLERALNALTGLGFKLDINVHESRTRSHHLELSHPTLPKVELHFRLSHGAFGIPVDGFIERAHRHELPGGPALWVLNPADELFHLVLHRAYGRFATLFHLYEIKKIVQAVSPSVVNDAIQTAKTHHFLGAFLLTDVALRTRWETSLLPLDNAGGRTWLQFRINPGLYRSFETFSDPNRQLTLSTRLHRRWIDLQITDGPTDALRLLGVMTRVGWFQIRHQGWRTVDLKGRSDK
jgi:hypothetical protein